MGTEQEGQFKSEVSSVGSGCCQAVTGRCPTAAPSRSCSQSMAVSCSQPASSR